jgi:hypothetical protein
MPAGGDREQRQARRQARKEQRSERQALKERQRGDEGAAAAAERDRARLLGKLALADDDELERLRDKRLPEAARELDVDDLRRLRGVLRWVIAALEGEGDVEQIRDAYAMLLGDDLEEVDAVPPAAPSAVTNVEPLPAPRLEPPRAAAPSPDPPTPQLAAPPPPPLPARVASPALAASRDNPARSPWLDGAGPAVAPPVAARAPAPPPAAAPPPVVAPPAIVTQAPAAVPPAEPKLGDADGVGTAEMKSKFPREQRAVLPFQARADTPQPAAAPADDGDPCGDTIGVDDGAELHATLPFGARAKDAGPAIIPELSVEQYASLCAERSLPGADRSATQRRYGLADDAGARRLDAIWEERFRLEPPRKMQWQQLVAHYTQWFKQRS